MFYRTTDEIKTLDSKYYPSDATTGPSGHTNPAEFIPYSSIPYFSPTTIRNIVKALRTDLDFVEIHFCNPQFNPCYDGMYDNGTFFGTPSIWSYGGGAMYNVPVEVFNVFALNAPKESLPPNLMESKGFLRFDAFTGRWSFVSAEAYRNMDRQLRDKWDRWLQVVHKGRPELKSYYNPTKNLFLVKVRLTWLLNELHTIIRSHNTSNRNSLQRLQRVTRKRNPKLESGIVNAVYTRNAFSNIERSHLPSNENVSKLRGYQAARSLLRKTQRDAKIPFGYHMIFNNYPSHFFNFLDHLSNKEKTEIRKRYIVANPFTTWGNLAFVIRNRESEVFSYNVQTSNSRTGERIIEKRIAPLHWRTTGVLFSCDCCKKDGFSHSNMYILPHVSEKWAEWKPAFYNLVAFHNRHPDIYLPQLHVHQYATHAAELMTIMKVNGALLKDYRKTYFDAKQAELDYEKALEKYRSKSSKPTASETPHPSGLSKNERLLLDPAKIPNNILWAHDVFSFNKRANLSPKDHLQLFKRGVDNVSAFIHAVATPAEVTKKKEEDATLDTAAPVPPSISSENVLLDPLTYSRLKSEMAPALTTLMGGSGIYNYNEGWPHAEQYRSYTEVPTKFDTVCQSCTSLMENWGRHMRAITLNADPATIKNMWRQQVQDGLNLLGRINGRDTWNSMEYMTYPGKHFHNLLSYLQGGHFTTLERFGGRFTVDTKNRLIKNYSENPLNFGNFSRSKGEHEKLSLVNTHIGVLGRGEVSRVNDQVELDTTCYLGVELEVTANKQAFDLARDAYNRLDVGNADDAAIKELGVFLAASTANRYFVENGKSAIIKYDGSCSAIGFEIVSVPGTHAWHLNEAWKGFFKEDFTDPEAQAYAPSNLLSGWPNNGRNDAVTPWNKEERWKTPTCGIHIHVSRNALTPLQLGKMLVYVTANEDGFIEKIAGRSANTYSKFIKKDLKHGASLGRGGSIITRGSNAALRAERYEAINLTSTKGTVEFRIFRSNVSKAGFFKCIDFVQALVDWTRDASLAKLSNKQFIGFVIDNRGKYPWFSKWLIDSKYVQTVATLNPLYTPNFKG